MKGDARREAVLRVVAAARRLARGPARAPLVRELAATTGLSPEGVERGLDHHLELEPEAADVAKLVAGATVADAVHVILSANVFVGALRAVALAVASGGEVTVRPSRREPAFARALLGELADPRVRLDEARRVDDVVRGEIHVYGHDATVAQVRAAARPGVVVRGHGSGLGVGWLSRGGALASNAEGLADDVVAFDQRGCLSPRLVLVEGELERARAFAGVLSEALTRRARSVPRGEVPEEVAAEAARWQSALAYAGEVLGGSDHVVGVLGRFRADALPPPYRHVLIAPVESAAAGAAALGPLARAIVAVGSDVIGVDGGIATLGLPRARFARFGGMQRPPLDGPVDGRDAGP